MHSHRNTIMHHIIPEELDVSLSVVAWALLGLLSIIKRRYNIKSDEIIYQSPPIETELLEHIRLPRFEPYMKNAENMITEYCDYTHLYPCPLCGRMSVLNGSCEVCFEELKTVVCDSCGEECIVPWNSDLAESINMNVCPSCGEKL